MRPILFKISGINFYTHGFFLVLAMLAAGLLLHFLANRHKRNAQAVFDLVVFSLLSGVIFARLTYFLIYKDQFADWTDLFRIWQGGLVSWGGFIAGILTFVYIVRLYREPILPWLDLLGISGLLGIVIGRIGSFLSGEYAGKATQVAWAIHGVHAVTLYEAFSLSLLFFLFLSAYIKRKLKSDGKLFLLVILAYSLVRFVLDFFRTDSTIWLSLTFTQIISAIIILGIIIYTGVLITTRKGAGHAGF